MRSITGKVGRLGCIVPSGIATDDTTKFFFQDLMSKQSLVSLYDFENRRGIFAGVHRSYKFCLITLTGASRPNEQGADFVFFALGVEDLNDRDKHFTVSAEDLSLLNPNTGTCSIFRSKLDADLTKAIYRRVPVLVRNGPPKESPWQTSFLRMFDMTNDASSFRTKNELESNGWFLKGNIFLREMADKTFERCLPLYEAKMLHQFDHRWATYDGNSVRDISADEKRGGDFVALPRYWVPESDVAGVLRDKWQHKWLMGVRGVCRTTDERSSIFSIFPYCAAGNSILVYLSTRSSARALCAHLANLNSLVFDYVARQKVGGINFNMFIIEQLPALPPSVFRQPTPWDADSILENWIVSRTLELVYSASDLKDFALECGYEGPVFPWNDQRRFEIRCELDAAFCHLYGLSRDEVVHLIESFPLVQKSEMDTFGEFRTLTKVLDSYDLMSRCMKSRSDRYAGIDGMRQ